MMTGRAAAAQGNVKAMHNLAVLFAEGAEGEPDYEQAALWFRQSSEYGLKDSQYNLAVLYARGLGVEQNLAESYRWFAAAAEQGDAEAAVQRDEVARRLDSDALAAAKLVAQSWQPKALVDEANRVAAPDDGWDDDTPPAATEPGNAVQQAQALLDRLGFEPGPIDGQAGALTRRAVIEFQRATGLPETGEVTPDLLDRLYQEAS
jgi:localization factor PodJL